MNGDTRRGFYTALAAFIGSYRARRPQAASDSTLLAKSEIFPVDQMPAITTANGGKRWEILHRVLPTGESVSLHASMQPAGATPNPPHAIQHSEVILVQEGTMLFEYEGKSTKVGAGGVIFVAVGTMHSARNIGNTPAKYYVLAIGGDTK